ncbi:uncharacterized protein LOC127463327 [Manacus candei]|uniref:uncharacterized protein LOC127463327 n=1 Tax=Manacus candei TaxID=415023 RepID=UPI0022270B20|nr:uncharacterized protein LOC127463327 [Manacus candei]
MASPWHSPAPLPLPPLASHLPQLLHSTEASSIPKPAPRTSESEDRRNEHRESRSSSLFGSRRQDVRRSISELPEPKDEKRRLSHNMSESSPGSSDSKQPPPSRAAAGAQPSAAGLSLSPTGFGGRVKSASKVPPLPRKISPAVYETFLEQSNATAGGKASTSPTADGNRGLKSPPLPLPKSKRMSQL